MRTFAVGVTVIYVLARVAAAGPLDSVPVSELVTRCEQGAEGEACFELGGRYEKGTGVPKDLVKAVSFLERACNASVIQACVAAGSWLTAGKRIARDSNRAVPMLEKACAAGKANSCFNLGIAKEEGSPTDLVAARAHYIKGCDMGVLPSCARASKACLDGIGGAPDNECARSTGVKACRGSSATGCTSLGLLFQKAGDSTLAFAMFQRACELGAGGEACADAAGAMSDEAIAASFHDRACKKGRQASCSARDALARRGVAAAPWPARDDVAIERALGTGVTNATDARSTRVRARQALAFDCARSGDCFVLFSGPTGPPTYTDEQGFRTDSRELLLVRLIDGDITQAVSLGTHAVPFAGLKRKPVKRAMATVRAGATFVDVFFVTRTRNDSSTVNGVGYSAQINPRLRLVGTRTEFIDGTHGFYPRFNGEAIESYSPSARKHYSAQRATEASNHDVEWNAFVAVEGGALKDASERNRTQLLEWFPTAPRASRRTAQTLSNKPVGDRRMATSLVPELRGGFIKSALPGLGPMWFEPAIAGWLILPGDRIAIGARLSYGLTALGFSGVLATRVALASSGWFLEGAGGATEDAWRGGGAIGFRPKPTLNFDFAVTLGVDWFGMRDDSGSGLLGIVAATVGFGGG